MNQKNVTIKDNETHLALLHVISKASNQKIHHANAHNTFEQCNVDSVQLVEIIIAVESEFEIALYDEDICNLTTPNSLLEYTLSVISKKKG